MKSCLLLKFVFNSLTSQYSLPPCWCWIYHPLPPGPWWHSAVSAGLLPPTVPSTPLSPHAASRIINLPDLIIVLLHTLNSLGESTKSLGFLTLPNRADILHQLPNFLTGSRRQHSPFRLQISARTWSLPRTWSSSLLFHHLTQSSGSFSLTLLCLQQG